MSTRFPRLIENRAHRHSDVLNDIQSGHRDGSFDTLLLPRLTPALHELAARAARFSASGRAEVAGAPLAKRGVRELVAGALPARGAGLPREPPREPAPAPRLLHGGGRRLPPPGIGPRRGRAPDHREYSCRHACSHAGPTQ